MTRTATSRQLDRLYHPGRPALAGLIVTVLLLLVFLLWASLTTIASSAIANGRLQVIGQRQSVQHPHGGVVQRLLVAEGDHVTRNDLLIELDPIQARANRDIAAARLTAMQTRKHRLECERDSDDPVTCLQRLGDDQDAAASQALRNERALAAAQLATHRLESQVLDSRAEQLQQEIAGLQARLDSMTRQRTILQDELQTAQDLLASKLGSRSRVMEVERLLAGTIGDQGGLRAQIASANQQVLEVKLEAARLEAARTSRITDELRSTDDALAEARPRLAAARRVSEQTDIRAPVSGQVVGLSVFTEGGVVQPGEKLMDIVPDGAPIIVEAKLSVADIDGIAIGDTAEIKLTGLPRATRPQIAGRVTGISADRLTDSVTGRAYYALRIAPLPDDMARHDAILRPGMPADVIINRQSRTVMGYLLGPLMDEIYYAFREE